MTEDHYHNQTRYSTPSSAMKRVKNAWNNALDTGEPQHHHQQQNQQRIALVSEGYTSSDDWLQTDKTDNSSSGAKKKKVITAATAGAASNNRYTSASASSSVMSDSLLMNASTTSLSPSMSPSNTHRSSSTPSHAALTNGDQEFDIAMYKLTKLFNAVESKDEVIPKKTEERMLNSIDKREYGYTSGLDLKEYLPGQSPSVDSSKSMMSGQNGAHSSAATSSAHLRNSPNSSNSLIAESPVHANSRKVSEDRHWNSVAPHMKSETQKVVSFKQKSAILVEEQRRKEESYRPSFENPDTPSDKKQFARSILAEANIKVSASEEANNKKSMNKKQWDSLVDRLNKVSDRKLRKMDEIAKKKEEELTEEITFTPNINPRSRNIASSNSSLTDRMDSFLDERKKKLEMKKRQLEEAEKRETTFRPKLSSKTKKITRDVDTLFDWNKQRNEKLEELRSSTMNERLGQCTFKPDVSNRTKKIMEKLKSKAGCNVFDRNYNFEFVKQARYEHRLRDAYQVQSSPMITDLASHLPRDEPVGERLYRLAMKSLQEKDEMRRRRYESLTLRTPGEEIISHVHDYEFDDDDDEEDEYDDDEEEDDDEYYE